MFFPGPCAGGSPWNRLNRNMGSLTAHNIQLKAIECWELWEEFAKCLNEALFIGAKAMLELPRGCDYWRDKRMMDMVRGTDSNTHGFDGCMYDLRSRFRNVGVPIKEPWRIISWEVSFNKLLSKCDGSHDHEQCAGKETRVTQLYTLH